MSTPPRHAASADDARRQLDELDALLQRMLALPVNPDDEIVRDVPAPRGGTDQPDVPWPTNTYPAAYMVVQTSGPQDLPPAEPDPPSPEPDLGPDVIPAGQGEEGGTADPFEPPPHEPPFPEQDQPPRAGADEEGWVPFRSSWQPSSLTWQPLAESWQQSRASAPPAPLAPAVPAPEGHAPEPAFGPSPDSGPLPEPPPDPVGPAALAHAPSPARWLLPLVWFNRGFDACVGPWGPPGRWLCGPAGKTLLGVLGLLSLAGAAALVVAEGIGWTR